MLDEVCVIACNGVPMSAYDSENTAYIDFRNSLLENHREKTAYRIVHELFDKGSATEILKGKKYKYTRKSLWICRSRDLEENCDDDDEDDYS